MSKKLLPPFVPAMPENTAKLLPPFVATIEFKPENLFQGKFKRWNFRSDLLIPKSTSAKSHLEAVLTKVREYHGQYVCASVFDNRMQEVKLEEDHANRLILQVWEDNVHIDKLANLNLSFLWPSFDTSFLYKLAREFQYAKEEIDGEADRLENACAAYKDAVLNPTIANL